MAVDLKYYLVDQQTGQRTLMNDTLAFGNLFKGSQSKLAFTIFNEGDTVAVSPTLEIMQYPTGDFDECYQWKRISLSENDGYGIKITLPDIQPNSWLEGKDIVEETFDNYAQIAGTKPDQSWLLWHQSDYAWEVLRH